MTQFHKYDESRERGTIWHWFVAIMMEGDSKHTHIAYGEAAGVEAAQTCAEVIFQNIPEADVATVVMWTWDGSVIHGKLRHAEVEE